MARAQFTKIGERERDRGVKSAIIDNRGKVNLIKQTGLSHFVGQSEYSEFTQREPTIMSVCRRVCLLGKCAHAFDERFSAVISTLPEIVDVRMPCIIDGKRELIVEDLFPDSATSTCPRDGLGITL